MRRHRTTARRVLFLAATIGLAVGSAAAFAAPVPEHIIFPVVGKVAYIDDFGAPRPGGPHQGNDIMAEKKSPAVAAEPGKVKYWATSSSAGCMLYLYGDSGTTYLYIHLNNDLTMRNDNRGKCVPGVSYARGLKDGARVQAAQMIGYVGDSGDANGGASHLHFEVHPGGGAAVSPFPYLQSAQHLLFFAKIGTPFSLALTGTVGSTTDTTLTLTLSQLQAFPMNLTLKKLTQQLTLTVPVTAAVLQHSPQTPGLRLLAAYQGDPVVVWTLPALATTKAMLGATGALTAALVQLD